MTDADEIKGDLDAIGLLFEARTAVMKKRGLFYLLLKRWQRDSDRLRRAQFHLLNHFEFGGWNCFRD